VLAVLGAAVVTTNLSDTLPSRTPGAVAVPEAPQSTAARSTSDSGDGVTARVRVTVPALSGTTARGETSGTTLALDTLTAVTRNPRSTLKSPATPSGRSLPPPSSTGRSPRTAKRPLVTPPSTTPPAVVAHSVSPVPARYRHLLGWIDGGRVVSLTFDDGPSAYTGRILDILDRYGIKATFCQIGRQVADYPAIEKRIARQGHNLCNHTWDHDESLAARSTAVIDSEISRTQQVIQMMTGVTPHYYRAPGGFWGTTSKLRIELAKFHTVPLAWADDSLDWRTPGVGRIVKSVLSTVTPGAIILMHDGGGDRSQTLAALPQIITALRADGYTVVGLPRDPP
jgi:peptidoglycan/xylan/chitin deacetylase (PgdA/CDA1 family)